MPYDPTDPLGLKNRAFGRDPFGNPLPNQQAQPLPALAPEEEESLLSRVGGKLLGGLGYVGDFLDKYTGGRAARGLLGGKPEELASILPFSDKLGVTDEANKVSGRDLADQWGLSEKGGDSGWDTAKGIGVDVLTNPTSYLTFGGGALTEAGKQARRIGALPETTMGRIKGLAQLSQEQLTKAGELGIPRAAIEGQALGGVAGLGLPFSEPSAILGAGKGGEAFLNTIGGAANWLGHSSPLKYAWEPLQSKVLEPLGRNLNALFNYKVGGATSAAGQQAGRAYTEGVRKGLEGARGTEAGLVRGLEGAGVLERGRELRQIGEDVFHGPLTAAEQTMQSAAGGMKGYLDTLDAEGSQLGFAAHKLADTEADYLPRHMSTLDKNSSGFGGSGQALPTHQAALEPREEFLKNIPGGTEQINRLSQDPDVWGINARFGPQGASPAGTAPTTALDRAATVRQRYLGVSPQDEANMVTLRQEVNNGTVFGAEESRAVRIALDKQANGVPLAASEVQRIKDYQAAVQQGKRLLDPTEEVLLSRAKQSEELAGWAARQDPKYLTAGPFFGNHPVEDFMQTAAAKIKRNEAGKAIHDLFGGTAKSAAEAGPGWVRLDKALEQVGFDDPAAAQGLALAKAGQAGKATVPELYVPPEVVSDATRFLQPFQAPAALKPVIGAIDYMTNLTKSLQTALWPGFHARNAVSGVWQNWVLGAHDPRFNALNPMAWVTPIKDAQKLLRGGVVEGAAEIPYLAQRALQSGVPMTDAAATAELANLAHQYRAVSGGVHEGAELTGAAQAAALKGKIPGMEPFQGYGATLKEAVPGSLEAANPLNVAGVGANKDLFAPVAAGRKIGNAVEDTNRLSAFVGLMRQGMHPEEAATLVRAAHVDYSALSQTEREVMRRLIPFYTWTRRTTPWVLDQLATRPGGLAGSWAMATNEIRSENQGKFLPDYLGSGLAVPLGKEEDGTQRFLTQVDTPIESVSSYLRPSLAGTGQAVLSQLNPLLKMPLEYATGKQFMSGRNLADLYPITGSTLADQLIANSPVSRVYTTARTLADERKGIGAKALNLLSGVKVSDVDMEKAKDLAARDLIAEALRGQQGVGRSESYYLRPGMLEQLTPEQVALLRLEKSVDARAKSRQRVGVPAQP